jgi:predicted MFS family arabinose efflux permease
MQKQFEMAGAPPAVQPIPSSSSTHWRGVALVVAAGVMASLQVGKVAIAVPQLRADFGLDLSMVGWLMAMFSLLGVVGAVPVGAWVARAGDRRLVLAGLLAIAIGSAVGALAAGVSMLLAGRVIEGLGFVLITIAGPSVLQRLVSPGGKDLAFAIWSCFMPSGIAIALFSGSLLDGWRGFWLGNSVLAVLLAVLLLLGVPRRSAGSVSPAEAPVSCSSMMRDAAATAKAGAPALIAASFVIYSLQFFALFSFLPVLLIERMGVGTATAGSLSAVACCVNVGGNLAAGFLLKRGAPRWLLAAVASALMGVSAIGIFLPVFGAVPAFLLCLAFSGTGGLLPATLIGTSPIVAPSARLVPMSMGLLMLGSNLGQMIGPVIVGGAVDSMGWPAAAVVVALAGAAGVLLALGLRRSMARNGHPPQGEWPGEHQASV